MSGVPVSQLCWYFSEFYSSRQDFRSPNTRSNPAAAWAPVFHQSSREWLQPLSSCAPTKPGFSACHLGALAGPKPRAVVPHIRCLLGIQEWDTERLLSWYIAASKGWDCYLASFRANRTSSGNPECQQVSPGGLGGGGAASLGSNRRKL